MQWVRTPTKPTLPQATRNHANIPRGALTFMCGTHSTPAHPALGHKAHAPPSTQHADPYSHYTQVIDTDDPTHGPHQRFRLLKLQTPGSAHKVPHTNSHNTQGSVHNETHTQRHKQPTASSHLLCWRHFTHSLLTPASRMRTQPQEALQQQPQPQGEHVWGPYMGSSRPQDS
jgi:hypothetical protein